MGKIRVDVVYRHIDFSVLLEEDYTPYELQVFAGRRRVGDHYRDIYEDVEGILAPAAAMEIYQMAIDKAKEPEYE
jgi:hypothetical protein